METELRELFQTRSGDAPAFAEAPASVLRRARRRQAVNAVGAAGAVAAVTVAILIALGARQTSVQPPPATQPPTGSQSFDGTIYGWRIAPERVLEAEGLQRNLAPGLEQAQPGCTPKQVSAVTTTSLDFTVGYLPSGLQVTNPPSRVKWVCGRLGLSALSSYNFEDVERQGVAMLTVERALMDKRIFGIDVPADRVEACTVRGLKAICIHPENDLTGRGTTTILIIEENVMDPFVTRMYLQADEIPYSEVLKIAENTS
jgi:hypothetical protein